MKNKHWTAIGASYAVFAIAIATLATYQASSPSTSLGPAIMAQADQSPGWRSERLYQSDENPRRNLFLTIWSTRNCGACTIQEREIPVIQAAGYNVTLRKVPAPRWVKSFPTTVVTRDSIGGEEVTRYSGARTLAEIDEILKIGETPEEEDEEVENNEDYDIFQPWSQSLWKPIWKPLLIPSWEPEWYRLYVRENVNRKQAGEIEILRDMGFKITPMDATGDGKYPCAALVYVRGQGDPVCIRIWWESFTAEDVLKEVRPSPYSPKPMAQVNTFNLIVWLDDSDESDRQYDEIAKLRTMGFSANVYMVNAKRKPAWVKHFPTVVLVDNTRKGKVVCVWSSFVDANTVRLTANKRT